MEKLKYKYKLILISIIILAIIIRIIFVCKTNISSFQFDVGIGDLATEDDYNELYENFDEEPNRGRHINYIMHLYTYNSLPNEIIGQFYHPPLHHFIMSNWLKIVDFFSNSSSFKFESMQFITLVYSIIILISLYKILEELKLDSKNKILPMMLFSFYPLYIFMSGSINNDELVTMFGIICILYLIKWQKKPNIKNASLIALFIGLGLMTKTSMIVMIIPTIYIYFKKLFEFVNNDKSIVNLLIQLVIFAVISGSLGLWFHFRSLANGLNTLGIIDPFEYLSIKDKSFIERFGVPNIFTTSAVNIWNFLIYSSLNFAFKLEINMYDIVLAILVIILALDVIYFIIKNYKQNKMLALTFLSWWISYFYLNISMPYTCSMHSRYMLVAISIGIIFLEIGVKSEKNKLLKKQVYICSILISILSIIKFIV